MVAGAETADRQGAAGAGSHVARNLGCGQLSRAQAHAVKLGGNFLISAMIYALSEAFVFAEGQGITPETFL